MKIRRKTVIVFLTLLIAVIALLVYRFTANNNKLLLLSDQCINEGKESYCSPNKGCDLNNTGKEIFVNNYLCKCIDGCEECYKKGNLLCDCSVGWSCYKQK